MLFLHEYHEVVGMREADFEACYREAWMPLLAKGDAARLLYFMRQSYGTGPAYTFITVTAIRNGEAWEDLVRRIDSGDLRTWADDVDTLRHDVRAKILIPVPWSPVQEVDFDEVPTSGAEHGSSILMLDSVWPYQGRVEDYVAASGSHYRMEMEKRAKGTKSTVAVEAAFRPAFGSHQRREVVLWQRVLDTEGLVALIQGGIPQVRHSPGTWMHDALAMRDRLESRLLHVVPWSPLY
jgi:hypothetical protein